MDEQRIRQIVREEIEAANVLKMAAIKEDGLFSEAAKRQLGEAINAFIRGGGQLVAKDQ